MFSVVGPCQLQAQIVCCDRDLKIVKDVEVIVIELLGIEDLAFEENMVMQGRRLSKTANLHVEYEIFEIDNHTFAFAGFFVSPLSLRLRNRWIAEEFIMVSQSWSF